MIWGDVVFSIVTFVILMLVLRKFAWGPIMNMMKQREEHVASEIETAEKNRQDAEKYVEEQRQELERAKDEAQSIIENAKKTSEKQGEDIIAQSRAEAERMKENALADIAREKEQAVAELREQVGSLSVMIASKIIEKELDEKEQEQLIEDYVKEAGDRL
ncbi:ATP synthase F0 subunit B [Salibacterium salarium]|uniref:ATP synthase subunit b n=1 Tax=Salibacterium salarium TaxID=284579 RepID=A0A428MU63_9BACI|nr:F0F1 ATP synthase subunit B [Salibacterium salarium]RSL29683.1 ATP synthase F0 subunit B [Salibacterium salarium]